MWFESMISDLLLLESCHRAVSGVILACCLRVLERSYSISVTEELKVKVIKVMTLSLHDGEKELEYLQSLIKPPDRKLVLLYIQ